MPGSSKWSLSLRFPHQNPVYTPPLPHTCCMPYLTVYIKSLKVLERRMHYLIA
jgi:hypothetical protein